MSKHVIAVWVGKARKVNAQMDRDCNDAICYGVPSQNHVRIDQPSSAFVEPIQVENRIPTLSRGSPRTSHKTGSTPMVLQKSGLISRTSSEQPNDNFCYRRYDMCLPSPPLQRPHLLPLLRTRVTSLRSVQKVTMEACGVLNLQRAYELVSLVRLQLERYSIQPKSGRLLMERLT